MDLNKIDRLHAANNAFSERFDTSSGSVETNEENLEADKLMREATGFDKPFIEGHIILSDIFEQVKTKRSQGRNQVANSLKLYDRRTKQYISIAMISNIVVDEKAPPLPESVSKANRDQLDTIQGLFDKFLLNVHELL